VSNDSVADSNLLSRDTGKGVSVEVCGKRAILKTVRKSRQPAWLGLLRAAPAEQCSAGLNKVGNALSDSN
jgi:hypothetical protein